MLKSFCFSLLIILLGTSCFGQETASSLAGKIENSLVSSAGISMQFEIAGEGKVSLIINNESNQARIESPSILIISNGKTIWNYDKKADRVTIDNISSNSPFLEPHNLFQFSRNYSSRIISTNGDNYVLEFTPNEKISSSLKAAGGIEKLELTVISTKVGMKILKAAATSASGKTAVSGLTIKPLSLKSVNKYDFNFKPKSSTKVIDLRE